MLASWGQAANPASALPLLHYDELIRLYGEDPPPELVRDRLERLLHTPIVDNLAFEQGVRPVQPEIPGFGKVLRVVQWNVGHGVRLDLLKAALAGKESFLAILRGHELEDDPGLLAELEALHQADILVLNEIDWGMPANDYRNAPEELARALQMNYTFAVEFVELDPGRLAVEAEGAEDSERRLVDPLRYRGLHGMAILSRYQLQNVRLLRFKYNPYDWYGKEKRHVNVLERGKRRLGETVFREKVERQVRRGGRILLMAEIEDPDIPGGKASIVATHLEGRTRPEGRRRQLGELLAHIQDIDHPVILAGDFNTTGRDGTPTSFAHEIGGRLGSRNFWLRQAFRVATGVGLVWDIAAGGLNFGRSYADPTVMNVPLFGRNGEAEFFKMLERFRFSDGGALDFRGNADCSGNGRSGTLANSNERARKGFATTHELTRPVGPSGRWKLDWIFVKPPGLNHPRGEHKACRFAPHFPQTLTTLNYSVEGRLSDHNPILVDLPLLEPSPGE